MVTRDEYREILSRMDILEHDMSGLTAEVVELRREINARLDAVNSRFDAMEERLDARLDAVNSRFDAMEERFDARLDAMGERFDARFDHLQGEMNARFDTVNTRIDTIHEVVRSQTRWLIATLIALGGLISVLITVFEFIK